MYMLNQINLHVCFFHCFHCIDARLYNWTIYGNTLDWLPIIACSPLITSSTSFEVTYMYDGIEWASFKTKETRMELNVNLPRNEGISVSLQILEGKGISIKTLKVHMLCTIYTCSRIISFHLYMLLMTLHI